MTTEQMIAEMQARILKLEKKVYELPPSIYNPFLESMPNPITHLHTHDPNKVAAWKRVPEDMLEDIPDINKVMADADLKPLIRDWEVLEFRSTVDRSQWTLVNGLYVGSVTSTGHTLDKMLTGTMSVEGDKIRIHSVRRTTDGQVFTVGDGERRGMITRFFIQDNAMFAAGDGWDTLLRTLVKQVTHTTADGIAVKEGDTVYEYSNGVIMKTHFSVGKTYSGPLYSSREAAMKAKPIFTTSDGVPLFDSSDLLYRYDPKNGGVYELVLGNITPDTLNYQYYSSRTAAEAAYKSWLYDQPVLKLSDISGDNFAALVELVKSRLV